MKKVMALCYAATIFMVAGCGGGSDGAMATGATPAQLPGQQGQEQGREKVSGLLVVGLGDIQGTVVANAPAVTPSTATSGNPLPRASNLDASATDILVNGNFESGSAGWSVTDGVLTTDALAHSGRSYAWLGGYDNAFDRIAQSVAIPASASQATLQFWYRVNSSETTSGIYDGMVVVVHTAAADTTLKIYTNLDKTSEWVLSPAFDLGAFKGQTIELRFTAVTDASLPSSFRVDDVVVAITQPAVRTTTLPGRLADYVITQTASGYTVRPVAGTGAAQTFTASDRLSFSDTAVAFDTTTGSAGQVYRLYQAAFNRKPDLGGLGYQINAVEGSGLSLAQVSQNFIASPEFTSTYGSLSNTQFVTQLYANVLHRGPDASGLAYHLGRLASGGASRPDILMGFSESPENAAAVTGVLTSGIQYTPVGAAAPTPPVTPTCTAAQVLQNGVCMARSVSCVTPATLQNGACVLPAPTCVAPKVLQNGLCVPLVSSCSAPQVLQGGICVTPAVTAPVPTCTATQVLQNNVCVARSAVAPLNGTIDLERIVFTQKSTGPSFNPVLLNSTGETLQTKVCFAFAAQASAPYWGYGQCATNGSFKANTQWEVETPTVYEHGEFMVYVTRAVELDPTQTPVLVATYSAKDYGFLPNVAAPTCITGSIASSNPSCIGLGGNAPATTQTNPPAPPAPPATLPANGASGNGINAANCVSASRAGDTVTLTNNCGRAIFMLACGDLKYTSRTCGNDTNYFTQSTNSAPTGISQTWVQPLKPGGRFFWGACVGGISFGNDGNFKAYSNGSYVCLKQ